ncbi:hypothetical protein WH47_11227 [Habropoda laboriosa]|uniref:Kazal-like domain-containing protein n=1 Tax=Habropoda laboriosa TaxID=597456 RepID=A0A0L7QKU9_9HYME|nr:hypothetical protein WH47_11227 [Habropoda laboriosa]
MHDRDSPDDNLKNDNGGSTEVFEVDGFAFDGPVSTSSISGDRTSTPALTTSSSTSTAAPSNVQLEQCVAACPTTPEYNPVCGTDNAIYTNIGKLRCTMSCGKDVNLQYYGRCVTTKVRGG